MYSCKRWRDQAAHRSLHRSRLESQSGSEHLAEARVATRGRNDAFRVEGQKESRLFSVAPEGAAQPFPNQVCMDMFMKIPALGEYRSERAETDCVQLGLFLNELLCNRELRHSKDLVSFLSEDITAFKSYMEVVDCNSQKATEKKRLIELTVEDIENSKGEVELKMDPALRNMSHEIVKLVPQITPFINQAIETSAEVVEGLEKVRLNMHKLGMSCASIHRCYKQFADKFDFEAISKVESLYAELSKTFTDYGKIILDDKTNFSQNIQSYLSFNLSEIQGVEDVRQRNADAGTAQRGHKRVQTGAARIRGKEGESLTFWRHCGLGS